VLGDHSGSFSLPSIKVAPAYAHWRFGVNSRAACSRIRIYLENADSDDPRATLLSVEIAKNAERTSSAAQQSLRSLREIPESGTDPFSSLVVRPAHEVYSDLVG
jgi:hypothetical protein